MIKTILILFLLGWAPIAFSQTQEKIEEVSAPSLKQEDIGKITKRKNKYGIVTAAGLERVPAKYDSLLEITSDVIVATKKKKSGIITRDNKIIAPFIYDSITRFDALYKHVKTTVAGKKGILTYDGKVILDNKYTDVRWNKTGNFFLVYADNKLAAANQAGEMILPAIPADDLPDKVWEGNTVKYFYFVRGKRWGVVNADGSIAIPANYAHLHYIQGHKLFLGQSTDDRSTFTILDEKNRIIVPSQKIQYMVSPDFIIVKENGLYGAITVANKIVVPYGQYDELVCTTAGDCTPRVYVNLHGKKGVMDEKGNLLTEIKYDQLDYNKKGCFIETKMNQRSGLLDQSGKAVLDNTFLNFLIWTDAERIAATDVSGVRLFNFQGKQLSATVFERLEHNGSKKYFSFIKSGKYGLVNSEGEIVVKPEYDKIFEKRYFQKEIFGQQHGRKVLLVTE